LCNAYYLFDLRGTKSLLFLEEKFYNELVENRLRFVLKKFMEKRFFQQIFFRCSSYEKGCTPKKKSFLNFTNVKFSLTDYFGCRCGTKFKLESSKNYEYVHSEFGNFKYLEQKLWKTLGITIMYFCRLCR
jgi:hypothetical protein